MAEAPKKGRLTLYEDLLSTEARAELKAKEAATQAEEAKKKKDASLMFKPTNLGKKGSNNHTNSNKPKPNFAAMHKLSSSASSTNTISAPPTVYSTAPAVPVSSPEKPNLSNTPQQPPQPTQKRGFNDWLANEDEEWGYYDRKHGNARGNKKKKKNNKAQEPTWAWEDHYDPHTPVPFLDYPKSEVQFAINEAWKRRLYDAHKREGRRQGKEQRNERDQEARGSSTNMQFAPPSGLDFAPPANFSLPVEDTLENDDQFTRRAAIMAGQPHVIVAPPVHPSVPDQARPALPSSASPAPESDEVAEKQAKIAAQIAAFKAKAAAAMAGFQAPSSQAKVEAPPPTAEVPTNLHAESLSQLGVISAAPTFNPDYLAWKARQEASEPEDVAPAKQSDPEEPRSSRPGQSGFAERMLKKMGWEEGGGLGASGQGITTAIVARAQKRKKLPDSQGGGFAAPANMGKIVGGKKAKASATTSDDDKNPDAKFGTMSEVIKLEDILANMDVDKEIEENNLLQEIGDEMGEFGTVERLFIWRDHVGGSNEVFVKFTSQLSALRAVREMHEVEFAGNIVKAKFWDAEKFERSEYA